MLLDSPATDPALRFDVKHIRQWLELNQGRPSVHRRAIVDADAISSLR